MTSSRTAGTTAMPPGRPREADTVVVGAGLAGLTVAYQLRRDAPGMRVLVLEAATRPGGQIVTDMSDGYTFEHGASALVGSHPLTMELLGSLGLAGRVEPAVEAGRTTYLWYGGRLHPVPRSMGAAVRTRLLSRQAKVRVLAEPLLGRGMPGVDETVHEFAARRFGTEPAQVLVGALVQGITAGDARETDLRGLSERIWQLDQVTRGKSLLLYALRARLKQARAERRVPARRGSHSAGMTGPVTLRGGGLVVLVDALCAAVGDALECASPVLTVTTGTSRRYAVINGGDRTGRGAVQTDTVVFATPAHRTAGLLAQLAPQAGAALAGIDHADLRVIGLGFPRTAFGSPPRGFGFLSPPGQGLNLIGATVSSNAFPEQAPPGHVLIRVFAGGTFAPHLVDLSTEDAVRLVISDLRHVFDLHGPPTYVRDVRWRSAIPQYASNHPATVAQAGVQGLPGMHVTGNAYVGPGIGETLRSAVHTAGVITAERAGAPTRRPHHTGGSMESLKVSETRSPFLDAASGRDTGTAPVWLMRQAGRYLPEYQELKMRYGFWTMVSTPEIAAEVTLQPLRRFALDAAILFSDIMTPLPAMGVQIEFGPGPQLASPLATPADVAGLVLPEQDEIAPFVADAIRLIRRSTSTPLIGFAGAPLTLAAYLVQGSGGNDYVAFRVWLRSQPQAARDLLDVLTEMTIRYLRMQVDAGVQAVQLFDSWAGIHDTETYRRYGAPYLRRVLAALDGLGVPRIYLAVGASHLYPQVAQLPAEALSIDWRTPLDRARPVLGGKTLQGNLDPAVLLAPGDVVVAETQRVLRAGLGGPHVFNLGHGVLPGTPIDNVARVVDTVHTFDRGVTTWRARRG